ncbi:hypothetical protein XELAEV_18042643mg [Xenopus laevis]|uniref:Uncharacterized protein n=1 Tax=Xenopus laevis TaxID=8355 RepID=A0A974C4M2_XENLA|nr:hypothetical protein XELAEV_18042643mg [Xenopus laevis]
MKCTQVQYPTKLLFYNQDIGYPLQCWNRIPCRCAVKGDSSGVFSRSLCRTICGLPFLQQFSPLTQPSSIPLRMHYQVAEED